MTRLDAIALFLLAFGCGASQTDRPNVQTVSLERTTESPEDETRRAISALDRLTTIAGWRPKSVVRLDDTLAILDRSHAYIWRDGDWHHTELPGPAPFDVGSLEAPAVFIRGDGHRAVFAGASQEGRDNIELYELTLDGVRSVGVLPDWVRACRAFVMSGEHLYVVVADEDRVRDTNILHAEVGATTVDWSEGFALPSNTPDSELQMDEHGALLLRYVDDACEVARLPSAGPSYEPVPLFAAPRRGSCTLHVTPGRIVVASANITVYENDESHEVPWPSEGVPFEGPDDYEGYDALSSEERERREADSAARMSSPGLIGLRPLLFERFRASGPMEPLGGQGVSLPMRSQFLRWQDEAWVELPVETPPETAMVMAMHFAALTEPTWSTPVYWGPLRFAVADARWYSEELRPTLAIWHADGAERVMSAFPSRAPR